MKIGDVIRRIRKARHMTLVTLSEKSGVALATLSRIENGRMTGTLESHMDISNALGIGLAELYAEISPGRKSPEMRPRDEKSDIFVHDKKTTSEMLTSKVLDKRMMPILIRIGPGGATHKEENRPDVEKFIYVLAGTVLAVIGTAEYTLKKGDTLYFDAAQVHFYKNKGAVEARLISVVSPPTL